MLTEPLPSQIQILTVASKKEKRLKTMTGTRTAGSTKKFFMALSAFSFNVDFKPLTLHEAVGRTTLFLLLPH